MKEVLVASPRYVLAVGVYADEADAAADLRNLTAPGALEDVVAGAGILHRSWRSSALQQGNGGTTSYGAVTGAAAGIVLGVLLGAPLVVAGAGALVGGVIGRAVGRREVDGIVASIDDTVPVGATALIAVVEEESLPAVRARMARALRTAGRVLDGGPLTDSARRLVRGNPSVMEALDAQQRQDRPPLPM
jgi:uncharacterized membrane protein